MGRVKEPVDLLLVKGKANLTKEEISKRRKQEEALKGNTDNIQAPDYLSATQKKEFEALAAELTRLNIFSNLDVDNLSRYIDSREQYINLVKKIRKVKDTDDFKDYAAMQRVKNSLFAECRSAAGDLGLTVTSRLKLVIPESEEKPKSKFDKFIKKS